MGDALTIAYEGLLAEITLTRPEVLNRFDPALHEGFIEALNEVRHHGDVRAIVLASTGKVFSAGGDFDHIMALHDDSAARLGSVDDGRRLLSTLIDLPVPIVTALHGDAMGLGATIVLATDAVVAARGAGLSDPHVAVGLVAGDGGCVVWPASAGMLRAKRHLLAGDRLRAEDAFMLGLVTDLVDTAEETLPAARSLAQRMAALPPLASDDLVEAVTARREQRHPRYRGT